MPRIPKKPPVQSSGGGIVKKGVILVSILVTVVETFRTALPHASSRSFNLAVEEIKRDLLTPTVHVVEATSDTSSNTASVSTESQPTPTNPDDSTPEPPEQRKSEKVITKDSNRDIVFVHVGKAGGKSIRQNVAAGCQDQGKPLKVCLATFPQEEPLANQTRNFIHMWDLKPEVIAKATSFLVTLRNPIERIASVYRYTHPANCLPAIRYIHYGCYLEKSGKLNATSSPYYLFFRECFPNAAMEDLAQAVLPPYDSTPNPHFLQRGFTPEQQCKCRKFARLTLQGDPERSWVVPHMQYNYKYYADASYNKYPDKEMFALRTEQEYEDMVALDKALGGTGRFKRPNNHFSHGSEHYLPSPLTEEAYQKLCCVLESELNQYFDVFSRALNMNQEHLLEAKESMRSKCGLAPNQSWDDWRTKCRAKLAEPLGC